MSELYNDGIPSIELAKQKNDSLGSFTFDRKRFDAMLETVYQHRGYSVDQLASPEGRALIEESYNILTTPVQQGISQRTPANVQTLIESNLWRFSGFKTDTELREVASKLTNKDGTLKPFKEFAKEVGKIHEVYNIHYLQAEFDHVKRSVEMFNQWRDYAPDDILQYRTMGDNRVRDEHAALEGVTLPANDPFWESYYPPNGWRCRCSVRPVRKGKHPLSNSQKAIEAGDKATAKPSQKIFRTNPGKTLKLMPEKHPYFPKGCGDCNEQTSLKFDPKNEKCRACRIINASEKEIKEERSKKLKQADMEIERVMHERGLIGTFDVLKLKTNKLHISAKAIANTLSHSRSEDAKWILPTLKDNAEKLIWLSDAKVGEGKDDRNSTHQKNIARKINRGVVLYNYYLYSYDANEWYITMEQTKYGYELPYAISRYRKKE